MFSSLDRADIVLEPGPDGRQQFVQTDHRTTAEIEQDRELSVLFAIIRVLNPKRMAEPDSPEPVVTYSAQERPPEFFRRILRAAGARLVTGDDFRPDVEAGPVPDLGEIVQSAFADLARVVAAEYQVPCTPSGLATLESQLAESAGDPGEVEYTYWSAVLKLGSFAGELIRESNGGRWNVTDSGTLPLSLTTRFQGGEATVNPLGKAIKRFTNGEEDTLVSLVNLLRTRP